MNTVAATPSGLSAQNPWPGLRAFTEGDHEFFFGRERETAELLGIVKRASVVVLYGQSGLGKTSLLQAGLFPQLKRMDFLPVRLRLDHSEEAPPLAEQIKAALTAALDCAEINAPRPQANESLWEYFHRRDLDFWGARNRLITPIIILDQFEEVFTLGQRTARSAARVTQFAADLESVIEHRPPAAVRERLEQHLDDALLFDFQRQSVKFMLSLREDFLPQLDPWRTRMASLLPHRFRLERMTGGQALAVVERAGRDLVAPNVAQDIVEFVSRSQRKQEARVMEERDVEPALLSVVCDELNRRRLERHQAQITTDLLTKEREGIIQSFYDRSFDDVDNRVRDWVEDELLTASGHRDRAAMEDALRLGLPESAFDALVDRRVLHREERAGVVWLELTHDLLSDPASRSRADREQRQQAEALARREEELSGQLWRSRRLTMIFGFALLVTVAALFASVVYHNRARKEQQVTRAALTEAQQQKIKADESATQAKNSFQTAVESTDKLGLDLMDYVRGDMLVPTATVLKIIDMADQSYNRLHSVPNSDQDTSDEIAVRHARFLNKASLALQQVGYFGQGRKQAHKAMDLLASVRNRARHQDFQPTQAESLYAEGSSLVALGDYAQAHEDLERSRSAAQAFAAAAQPEAQRIYILSSLSMGDLATGEFEFDQAAGHYRQALQSIEGSGLSSRETALWRARALVGLALSRKQDSEADGYISDAEKALASSTDLPQDNPRRTRMFAELQYQRGFIANRSGKVDEAQNWFEQANRASEELSKRDPGNRDWQLELLQSQRGLGESHRVHNEEIPAEQMLTESEKGTEELSRNEPQWVQVRYLLAVDMLTLGNIKPWPALKDEKSIQAALKPYVDTQRWLQSSKPLLPKLRMLLARSYYDQGLVYESSADNFSGTEKLQKQEAALRLYQQARDTLHSIEREEKTEAAMYDVESADVLNTQEKPQQAILFAGRATALYQQVVKESPSASSYYDLSNGYVRQGHIYQRAKDYKKAEFYYVQASQAIDHALQLSPENTTYLFRKADIYAAMFDTRNSQNDFNGEVESLSAAVEVVWKTLERDYSDQSARDALDRCNKATDSLKKRIQDASKPASSASSPHLTPQQAEALTKKVDSILKEHDLSKLLAHNTQHAWCLSPMFPGSWRILAGTEFEEAQQRFLQASHNQPFAAHSLKRDQVLAIRETPVDFYPDAVAYEALLEQKGGDCGIVTYLQSGSRPFVFFNGLADVILLDINKQTPPRLDTADRATSYLRFFLGAVQADEGKVVVMDDLSDVRWKPEATIHDREALAKKIKPLVVEQRPDKSWHGIGTIGYAGEVFYDSVQLSRDGVVDQGYGDAVGRYEIQSQGFLQGVRGVYRKEMGVEWLNYRVNAKPRDEEDLKKLVTFYTDLKRWDDAIATQQKLVAINAKDNLKGLVTVYSDAGIPQMAVATQKKLIALDPDDLNNQWDLAVLYSDQEKWQDAMDLAQKLLVANPKNRIILRGAAYFYSKLGRPDDSLATYLKIEALYPKEPASHRDLGTEYSARKQWDKAVQEQAQVVSLLSDSAKGQDNQRANLANAYLSLSWYQLMAHDFNGALASSEAGRKVDDTNLPLETNHAHALLFLGRTQEADNLYLNYRGQKIGDKTWQQVILEDFDALEKENVPPPAAAAEITRLRTLLQAK